MCTWGTNSQSPATAGYELVRMAGVEPARHVPLPPQDSVSCISDTPSAHPAQSEPIGHPTVLKPYHPHRIHRHKALKQSILT